MTFVYSCKQILLCLQELQILTASKQMELEALEELTIAVFLLQLIFNYLQRQKHSYEYKEKVPARRYFKRVNINF